MNLSRITLTIARAALIAALPLPLLAAPSPDIGAPPGRLVDVGGRKLHLIASGTGSPTVVLEAGASSFAIDWALVQREVSGNTRVCAYDRAGSGWSDPSPGVVHDIAADLHALLEAAGEKPPYIMVGASAGALYVRLYQARYPAEVAGLVLVDPASEDRLFTRFEGKPVLIASLDAEQLRSTIAPRAVQVPRRAPQTGAPFDRLPDDLYAIRQLLDARLISSVPETVSYEIVHAVAEDRRVQLARLKGLRAAREYPLATLPLVVLTRDTDSTPALVEVHAALAKLSQHSRHTVVPGAGHEIHLFEPRAVIEAINDVIAATRQSHPPLRVP